MKPLIGHIKLVEGSNMSALKTELKTGDKKAEPGDQGEPPQKWKVMQSISALKEAKWKEHIEQQKRRWIELTQGGGVSNLTGTSTVTSMILTVTSTVMSTMEPGDADIEVEMDLEEVMQSQGDEEVEGYGQKYKTTLEDRTDWDAAEAKQKEEEEQKQKEKQALSFAEEQLQKTNRRKGKMNCGPSLPGRGRRHCGEVM